MPSSISSTELIEVGRVRGVHGLAGLVKVELHWGKSSALQSVKRAVLELASGERKELAVLRATPGKAWLVHFEGISDRDQALTLQGARLFVERAPLEPGEVYLVDLVGAEVVAPDGVVGRVVEVRVNPSVDSLIVEAPDGRRFEQPLAPSFVERLDTTRVILRNRDGLF